MTSSGTITLVLHSEVHCLRRCCWCVAMILLCHQRPSSRRQRWGEDFSLPTHLVSLPWLQTGGIFTDATTGERCCGIQSSSLGVCPEKVEFTPPLPYTSSKGRRRTSSPYLLPLGVPVHFAVQRGRLPRLRMPVIRANRVDLQGSRLATMATTQSE